MSNIDRQLAEKLTNLKLPHPITLMEVCGTHTHSLFTSGIRDFLPPQLKLLSGPGCPVCVTTPGYVDMALMLAKRDDVIIATFGDMMRIPGSIASLQQVRGNGANIKVVYSSLDALSLARDNPSKKIVFLAVGFETTAPTIAASILRTFNSGIKNLSFLTALKLMPNVLRTLLYDSKVCLNGLILPGHVCSITGQHTFNFVTNEFNIPAVIAGFEPTEMLVAILQLAIWATENTPALANLYGGVVKKHGNLEAKALIKKVFRACNAQWRGFGNIPYSGLEIKPELGHLDSRLVFGLTEENASIQTNCQCGEIIKGKKTPPQCPLFKTSCQPQRPLGPCMVSSEGACSAYYKYQI